MQKESGSGTAGDYLHEVESGDPGMDQLLPNWKHEEVVEKGVRSMDETQSPGSNTQAVEETKDDPQEPDDTSPTPEECDFAREN